ncbi:MAG: Crp/Fnr family transcriptional regulator [bacterium]
MGIFDIFFRTGGTIDDERLELLKNTALFQGLRNRDYAELSELLYDTHYEEGEKIFSEGDPSSAIYIIESGRVGLFFEDAEGVKRQLTNLEKGAFFGELALCQDHRRTISARTLEDSMIIAIFRQELKEYMDRERDTGNDILMNVVTVMGERLQEVNHQVQDLKSQIEQLQSENETE